MAFRDWLTSDGHFMLLYPWLSATGDKFVEHGHRLLGASVGLLSIILAVVVCRTEPRAWVRRFSLVILTGVVLQGVLGGMRVVFDERTLALVHGCTGPLFFALCVAMVVFTSHRWRDPVQAAESLKTTGASETTGKNRTRKFFQLTLICTGLAYGQLVLGAVVRHVPHMHAPNLGGQFPATAFQSAVYFHLLIAAVLLVYVMLLVWRSFRAKAHQLGATCLATLMIVQISLGASTWLVKYGMPAWATALVGEIRFLNTSTGAVQAAIITTHVAIGSLIMVLALAMALQSGRRSWEARGARRELEESYELEGVRRELTDNLPNSRLAPPNSQLSMGAIL